MSSKKDLTQIIEQEHLVARVPSLKGIKAHLAADTVAGIYFGMGGGNKKLTSGLPLDMLSMVLMGERIRRAARTNMAVLIANEITKTNPFGEERIERVMSAEQQIMEAIINTFGFTGWSVTNQSTLFKNEEYRKFVEFANRNLPSVYEQLFGKKTEHVYHFAIEMADINHFVGNGGIKLGWHLPPSLNSPHPMDEVKFDMQYEALMPDSKVSYVYVKGGITLVPDGKGMLQRAVPYISYDNESRILLSPDEDIEKKWKTAEKSWEKTRIGNMSAAIKRHYCSIIRLYAELVDQRVLEKKDIPEKLRFIIDSLYNSEPALEQIYRNGFNEQ